MTKLLTVAEVAQLLQVKPSTVYKYSMMRKLTSIKISGLLRFREEDLRDLIAQKAVPPATVKK